MTAKQLAALLNGREYGDEITRAEEEAAKDAGLVVMFGASDDLVEVCGALSGEYGAWNGATLYINSEGIVDTDDRSHCDDCKLYKRELAQSQTIKAKWCAPDAVATWTYDTDIPHETFDIHESDEFYCRGIVFALADVGTRSNEPDAILPLTVGHNDVINGCFCCSRIDDYEVFCRGHKMERPDYCPYCGKRIDWEDKE
jgi:hypothetical protein